MAPRPGTDQRGVLLEFESVTKHYRGLAAVDTVSLSLTRGSTLGLVGESGSGKTTCVRLVLGLEQPSAGQLTFDGAPYPRRPRGMRGGRRPDAAVGRDPNEPPAPTET